MTNYCFFVNLFSSLGKALEGFELEGKTKTPKYEFGAEQVRARGREPKLVRVLF